MVQKYKRKTDRGSWQLLRVQQAAQAVCNGEMSISEDAAAYRVPNSTLECHKTERCKHLAVWEDSIQHWMQNLKKSWMSTVVRCKTDCLD